MKANPLSAKSLWEIHRWTAGCPGDRGKFGTFPEKTLHGKGYYPHIGDDCPLGTDVPYPIFKICPSLRWRKRGSAGAAPPGKKGLSALQCPASVAVRYDSNVFWYSHKTSLLPFLQVLPIAQQNIHIKRDSLSRLSLVDFMFQISY